jgi:hypothetical protein
MMARLLAGCVAWRQPWLASLLLVGIAVLILRAVASMFQAQALLSQKTFNLKTYLRVLAGK